MFPWTTHKEHSPLQQREEKAGGGEGLHVVYFSSFEKGNYVRHRTAARSPASTWSIVACEAARGLIQGEVAVLPHCWRNVPQFMPQLVLQVHEIARRELVAKAGPEQ